jgi:hypothetical protein
MSSVGVLRVLIGIIAGESGGLGDRQSALVGGEENWVG